MNNLFDSPEMAASDLFTASQIEPTGTERQIAQIIAPYQGRENPISLDRLCAITGKSDRTVKGLVEQLVVTHKLRIGTRRDDPHGFFMITDAEDLAYATSAYWAQIRSSLRRLRVLQSERSIRELLGQLALDNGGQAQ